VAESVGTRRGSERAEKEVVMSHRGVEIVLGRLATDESLRSRFGAGTKGTLEELVAQGLDLSPLERAALEKLDLATLQRFAETLDPRLQKAALVHDEGAYS
jgi:hypothetical protein